MRSRKLPLLMLLLAGGCGGEPPPAAVAPGPPPALRAPDFGPAALPGPAPAPPAERHVLEVRIAPVQAGKELDHLDVTLRFSEPPGELGDPLRLRLSPSEGQGTGWPEAIEEMYARDAEGALPLKTSPATLPPREGSPYAECRSERRPLGAVNVSYRVRLRRVEGGYYRGIRAAAGGFEGSGRTFLALPETDETYKVRLSWDLGAAGEGVTAASTLGAAEVTEPLHLLRGAGFMAGRLGRLSVEERGARFEADWLGRTAFDPVETLSWVARAHAAAEAILPGPRGNAPFTVLVRVVPEPGTGMAAAALRGGLLFLPFEHLPWGRDARQSLAQTLVSQAGVRFAGPDAAATRLGMALAGYFARRMLLGAGLATKDEVADDLREGVETDDPGVLYTADLDAALRARSGGARSLADLALPLLEKARSAGGAGGAGDPAAAWRKLVGAELGAEAEARFDAAIVKGEPVTPAADAFGPCFKREKRRGPGASGFTLVRDGRAPPAACEGPARR